MQDRQATSEVALPKAGHCEWCGSVPAPYRVVGTRACLSCSTASPGQRVQSALAITFAADTADDEARVERAALKLMGIVEDARRKRGAM